MAPHSSTLAWKIPWTEEPGGLQSMGSLRVRHNWETSLSLFTFMHWRRKWQPTPVFLPGESQGQGEPGGLPSMGSHRVRHNWSNLAAAATSLLYSCWHLLIVFFILFESFLVIGMNSNFQLNSGQSPLFFSETPDLLQIFFPQTPLQKKERRGTTTLLPSRSRNSGSHTPSQARYVCVCVLWGWLLVTGGQGWELGDMSCLHWYHSRYELIISELLWNF